MSDTFSAADFEPLAVLVVDDEAPARERLRDLLGDIAESQPTRIVGITLPLRRNNDLIRASSSATSNGLAR